MAPEPRVVRREALGAPRAAEGTNPVLGATSGTRTAGGARGSSEAARGAAEGAGADGAKRTCWKRKNRNRWVRNTWTGQDQE
jgi:hypothetical protein